MNDNNKAIYLYEITSDLQMTALLCRKRRGTKEPLDESEEENEKAGLTLNIQKTKIMASGPTTYDK